MHSMQQVRVRLPARGDSGQGVSPDQVWPAHRADLCRPITTPRICAGMKYTLQVAPEDCTGCGICVAVCPAKDKSEPKRKAINLPPQAPLREREAENFKFFLDHSGNGSLQGARGRERVAVLPAAV